MLFENLTVDRVIIHEVFPLTEEKTRVQPNYGTALVVLSPDASGAFKNRVVEALGKDSQCLEMQISRSGPGSLIATACQLLDEDTDGFIKLSRCVADNLSHAQQSRAIPGGILAVFTGKIGHPAKRCVCCIKAEPHDGFTRKKVDGRIELELLKDLFLTPKAKLYKIGMFVEVSPGKADGGDKAQEFTSFVYDAGMTATNRDAAAHYFFDGFLGCCFPPSEARQTKSFYTLTRKFIDALDLPEEKKFDLHTALRIYLKIDQTPIQVSSFADFYFPDVETRDVYTTFMRENDFPTHAVRKDTKDIASHLKQRKVRFRSNIKLVGPADKFKDLVQVVAIDGPPDEHGNVPKWTNITIQDRIASEE